MDETVRTKVASHRYQPNRSHRLDLLIREIGAVDFPAAKVHPGESPALRKGLFLRPVPERDFRLLMAQHGLALLIFILFPTQYRLKFQHTTCDQRRKDGSRMVAFVQKQTGSLNGSRWTQASATTKFAACAKRWTPIGDSCDCVNKDLWTIRETHIRAPFG